jgi:hypothetical protein
MFAEMDTDCSGTISFEELREGLRHRGAHLADTSVNIASLKPLALAGMS